MKAATRMASMDLCSIYISDSVSQAWNAQLYKQKTIILCSKLKPTLTEMVKCSYFVSGDFLLLESQNLYSAYCI